MRQILWKTAAGSLLYLAVSVACLLQWHGSSPWKRLDWLAGSYFFLRLVGCLYSIISSLPVFHSRRLRQEWWALNSDPAGPRWVMFLMALDLLVFLDYGHWQITPWLAHPSLQGLGLALYLIVSCWQIWTDAYLARYFNQEEQLPVPIRRGPYRYMRHPRYAAAMAGKVAMALIFASLLGWLLAVAWAWLLFNKIAVEESHLRQIFGGHYESYAKTTARIVPGVY